MATPPIHLIAYKIPNLSVKYGKNILSVFTE